MRKCFDCGKEMQRQEGFYRYDESGLKNIQLVDVPIYKCPSCGESEVEIPQTEELHNLLGLLIAFSTKGLNPEEIRYLRKHMGYSQEELADKLGVSRITVNRWEARTPIKRNDDRHLRRIYIENKGKEFDRFTNVHRILLAVLEKSHITGKQKLKIRKQDWVENHPPSSLCSI